MAVEYDEKEVEGMDKECNGNKGWEVEEKLVNKTKALLCAVPNVSCDDG